MPNKAKGLSCKEDALNTQQAADLRLACVNIRDKFIIGCLLLAGLRVSELAHLKRSWVNFDENTITVPTRQFCSCWECSKKRNGEWRPKTKQGARTIRIHPQLRAVLEEYFATNEGIDLTRQRLWQRVKELANKARILHNSKSILAELKCNENSTSRLQLLVMYKR
ncbi:tyrosine-type recombinase/integrase [Chloroflexota bacterium]